MITQETAEIIKDCIESNKALGKPVPQAWIDSLAAFESGQEKEEGEVFSWVIEGHPLHECRFKELENTIPIKVREASQLDARFDYAQKLLNYLNCSIGVAEYHAASAKTPTAKKKAQKELAKVQRAREVRKILLEIIAELNRMARLFK